MSGVLLEPYIRPGSSERCRSGRTGPPAKRLARQKRARGFESLPLRSKPASQGGLFYTPMEALLGQLAVYAIGLSGLSLIVGYRMIRRGRRLWHHRFMLVATAFAGLFLVFYLLKWGLYGSTRYAGPEAWRLPYYGLLLLHTVLAAANGPMIVVLLVHAFRGRFDRHRRLARWTFPIWLFVAISGWIIYLVLRVYGEPAGGVRF